MWNQKENITSARMNGYKVQGLQDIPEGQQETLTMMNLNTTAVVLWIWVVLLKQKCMFKHAVWELEFLKMFETSRALTYTVCHGICLFGPSVCK